MLTVYWKKNDTPPGSPAAKKLGCTCPPSDPPADDYQQYEVDSDCRLHGQAHDPRRAQVNELGQTCECMGWPHTVDCPLFTLEPIQAENAIGRYADAMRRMGYLPW